MDNENTNLDSFRSLGLSDVTLRALEKKGFEEPTDIQKACIPLLLQRDMDVVGQAQTGTGKTAAFALPILERIDESKKTTQSLVLTPTRELAMQVASEINSLKGERKISVDAIYGGASYENQFRRLKAGLQIVVGTPGRIQDHLERGTLDLTGLSFAVLDEADEMLDMGFVEDIEKILSQTNDDKRMLFFSATMPDEILRLAVTFMKDYEVVRIASKCEQSSLTQQYFLSVREADKIEALRRIIDSQENFYAIIFCRTKVQCEEVGQALSKAGYDAEALHGDLSQKQRETILQRLREHRISILVATDVAARGIDIEGLSHVINYSIPQDREVYTHRIGRTGRAGKTGVSITFVTPSEKRRFSYIQKTTKAPVEEYILPEVDELIRLKKARINRSVLEALDKDSWSYNENATALLSAVEPQTLVRTLLAMHYRNELDRSQYSQIQAVQKEPRRHEKDETERLFIAKGRRDRLTKRSLANAIIAACHVRDEDINDIEVMENFSFVNVPSHLAHRIINAFRDQGNDGRPLVTRARAEAEARGKKGKKKSNDHRGPIEAENWDGWKGPKRKKKKDKASKKGKKN